MVLTRHKCECVTLCTRFFVTWTCNVSGQPLCGNLFLTGHSCCTHRPPGGGHYVHVVCRLSFIGRWKARIEALTASMAAHAPLPQTAHQPSALLNAFKGDKGIPTRLWRASINTSSIMQWLVACSIDIASVLHNSMHARN